MYGGSSSPTRYSDYTNAFHAAMPPLLNSTFTTPTVSGMLLHPTSRLSALAPTPLSTGLDLTLVASAGSSPTYVDSFLTMKRQQIDATALRITTEDEERVRSEQRSRLDTHMQRERERVAEIAREVEAERQRRHEAAHERLLAKERELEEWKLERQRTLELERISHLQEEERMRELRFQRELARIKAETSGADRSKTDDSAALATSLAESVERLQKDMKDREDRLAAIFKRRDVELVTKLEELEFRRIAEIGDLKAELERERNTRLQWQRAMEKSDGQMTEFRKEVLEQLQRTSSKGESSEVTMQTIQRLRQSLEEEKQNSERKMQIELDSLRAEHARTLRNLEEKQRSETRELERRLSLAEMGRTEADQARSERIREFEAQVNRLRDEARQLTADLNVARADKNAADRRSEELQTRIDRALADRTSTEATVIRERDEAILLSRKLQHDLDDREVAWKREKADLDRETERLKEADRDNTSKLRTLAADVERLRREVTQAEDAKRRQEQELAQRATAADRDKAALVSELEVTKKRESDARDELEVNRRKLQDHLAQISQLEADKKTAERVSSTTVENLRAELARTNELLQNALSKTTAADRTERELRDTIEAKEKALVAQASDRQKFIADKDITIAALSSQLESERNSKQHTANETQQDTQKLRELETVLSAKDSEANQLRATLRRMEAELTSAKTRCDNLEKDLAAKVSAPPAATQPETAPTSTTVGQTPPPPPVPPTESKDTTTGPVDVARPVEAPLPPAVAPPPALTALPSPAPSESPPPPPIAPPANPPPPQVEALAPIDIPPAKTEALPVSSPPPPPPPSDPPLPTASQPAPPELPPPPPVNPPLQAPPAPTLGSSRDDPTSGHHGGSELNTQPPPPAMPPSVKNVSPTKPIPLNPNHLAHAGALPPVALSPAHLPNTLPHGLSPGSILSQLAATNHGAASSPRLLAPIHESAGSLPTVPRPVSAASSPERSAKKEKSSKKEKRDKSEEPSSSTKAEKKEKKDKSDKKEKKDKSGGAGSASP